MKEPIKVLVEKEIRDIDDIPIFEGSVLKEINGDDRGVVVWVGGPDKKAGPCMAARGDIAIKISSYSRRVTNSHKNWRHLSREEQTYKERFDSWFYSEFEIDEFSNKTKEEQMAISGIMALLPIDIVDWENGPWPDSISDALRFLTRHLSKISGENE